MNTITQNDKNITSQIISQPAIKPDQINSIITSMLSGKNNKDFIYILFWAEWCKFCPLAKLGFVDFLTNRNKHDLPSLAIYQCEMHTIDEVRLHPVIQHPNTPWPEEKIYITSIPTTVLIRVNYLFPSIYFSHKIMDHNLAIIQWINYCIKEL